MAGPHAKGYQIIDLIGRGAGSEVYKARHMRSGEIAAVKIVRHDAPDSARLFKQITNEFKVARKWTHPNLVRLHELVAERLLLWKLQLALAMEYVPGDSLSADGNYTPRQIVDYYAQLADAMNYMHRHGYIHLDMKPQNVIVTPEGQAKIMDFGLCTRKGRYNPRVQGTPDFMAPEQPRKGWVDERTDIYNLGATLFHVITGKAVHMTLTSRTAVNGTAALQSETFQSRRVDVPPELESLILESCRPSPAERPATMERVLERLEGIRGKLTPQPQ
ncbi:MAG TPA: serine/threonine-protein kinase [Planctomycetota bacterium]|nr:serine/threonine-protein kinase [Planctomycetota bacterium]